MANFNNQHPINPKMDGDLGGGDRFINATTELKTWETKAEKANDVVDRLILEKIEADEAKKQAQQEMMAYVKKQEECEQEFTRSLQSVQKEILMVRKRRLDLVDKLNRCKVEMEAKRAESMKLKRKFKSYIKVPDTEIKLSCQNEEERDDNGQVVRGVFAIRQRLSGILQGGQALITFEEQGVASQILKIPKCSVSCDSDTLVVKPKIMTLDAAVNFEVHLDVSRRELQISNVFSSLPEERIKDRLEMSFSRPSRGGGEVERVEYNGNTGTGQITFLCPGVAEGLVLRGKFSVDMECEKKLDVGPVYRHSLHKFQTFCGTPKRTILLDDIGDVEDEENLQDHLVIHFQKPSNSGGEIEYIMVNTSRGKARQAFFFCDKMAEVNE